MRILYLLFVLLAFLWGYLLGYAQYYQEPIVPESPPMELPYLISIMECARDTHKRIYEDIQYKEWLEKFYDYVPGEADQREWVRVYDKVIVALESIE